MNVTESFVAPFGQHFEGAPKCMMIAKENKVMPK